MFPATVLVSLTFAIFSLGSATATPSPLVTEPSKFTLAFATRVNATGFGSILAADQARAKAFREQFAAQASGNAKRASSISATNTGLIYSTTVGVGSPPTSYTLFIDTASSNTWVGADKTYVQTSTSKSTGKGVYISYGSGVFSGTEYTDQVTLSPSLVIKSQSIGVASYTEGFADIDGILGIGPVDLTNGTVNGTKYIPTIADNLFAQGKILSEITGIFYAPTRYSGNPNGELTFGGVDYSKIKSAVKYAPITKKSPSLKAWGIDQSITYGSTPILSSTAGIVDTGTSLILIANDAYERYKQATGGTETTYTRLLRISAAQYKALKPLNFNIGGTTYSLSPNAQIWPRALNTVLNGKPDEIYLVVGSIGTNSGTGFDFINGYPFLERFYSVFDTTNKRVGFAHTEFTTATTN